MSKNNTSGCVGLMFLILIVHIFVGCGNPLPHYQVIVTMEQLNGRINGDVLVSSISRDTSDTLIREIAIGICSAENIDDIYLYSTWDAYHANVDGEYSESHPNALREGFLGSLINGTFTLGRNLYP